MAGVVSAVTLQIDGATPANVASVKTLVDARGDELVTTVQGAAGAIDDWTDTATILITKGVGAYLPATTTALKNVLNLFDGT